jgi:putative lipoic acid-binding regulatory protein
MDCSSRVLVEYPCDFSVKVMAHDRAGFVEELLSKVRPIIPDVDQTPIKRAWSRNKKYLSVTVSFKAESREHVERLYATIHELPDIAMVL